MSQPWMKFYPSDWRSDPALRMCSLAARGLWMEMLCVMHEADPCGSLVINGRALTPRQISALAGCSLPETEAALSELEEAGVFGRESDGTIYSRRMRRDVEKAQRDRDNGKNGGNPLLKPDTPKGVNPPNIRDAKVEDKAQKPEARGQKLEDNSLRSSESSLRSLLVDPVEVGMRKIYDRLEAAVPPRPDKPAAPEPEKPKRRRKSDDQTITAFLDGWAALSAATRLPACLAVTDKREARIAKRGQNLVEAFGFETPEAGFAEMFGKIRGSPFLLGQDGRWRCDIDWVLEEANFVKIMEGKYAPEPKHSAFAVVGGRGHR